MNGSRKRWLTLLALVSALVFQRGIASARETWTGITVPGSDGTNWLNPLNWNDGDGPIPSASSGAIFDGATFHGGNIPNQTIASWFVNGDYFFTGRLTVDSVTEIDDGYVILNDLTLNTGLVDIAQVDNVRLNVVDTTWHSTNDIVMGKAFTSTIRLEVDASSSITSDTYFETSGVVSTEVHGSITAPEIRMGGLIELSGSLTGESIVTGILATGDATVGTTSSTTGVHIGSYGLDVGAHHVTLLDANLAWLDGPVAIAGGRLSADNGVFLNYHELVGYGTIDSIIETQGDTMIQATGPLTLGKPFDTESIHLTGTLDVGSHTVTVRDLDRAEFIGEILLDGGTLIAVNGIDMIDDEHTSPRIEGGAITGRGTIEGRVRTNEATVITPNGSLSMGDSGRSDGIEIRLEGTMNVGAHTVELWDRDYAELGDDASTERLTVSLNGGTLVADNGIELKQNVDLVGRGTVAGAVNADFDSVIKATGDMELGDASRSDGFRSEGELRVGAYNVQLRDSNVAVLRGRTTVAGGTLAADSLSFLETEFVGFGVISAATSSSTGTTIEATGTLDIGLASDLNGVSLSGALVVGGEKVRLWDADRARLGGMVSLDGGQLAAERGVLLSLSSILTGSGTVAAPVLIDGVVEPTGALTVGDASSSVGFELSSSGTLEVGPHDVTILDADVALFGGVTNVVGGTLRVTRDAAIPAGGLLTLDGGLISVRSLDASSGGALRFREGTMRVTGAGGLEVGRGPLGNTVNLIDGMALDVYATTHVVSGGQLVISGGQIKTGDVVNDGILTVIGTPVNFGDGGLMNNHAAVLIQTTVEGPVHNASGAALNLVESVTFLGPVSGAGGIYGSGTAIFAGGHAPGDSTAVVTVETDAEYRPSGTLTMEFAGTTPGAAADGHDQVVVGGEVSLAGGLDLVPLAAYKEPTGRGQFDRLILLTATNVLGAFENVAYDGQVLAPSFTTIDGFRSYVGSSMHGSDGLFRELVYEKDGVVFTNYLALPGDADGNGRVDDVDWGIWNSNRFTDETNWMTGDFNADGLTDGKDFNIWLAHRGQAIAESVPEPTGVGWMLVGLWCWSWAARKDNDP